MCRAIPSSQMAMKLGFRPVGVDSDKASKQVPVSMCLITFFKSVIDSCIFASSPFSSCSSSELLSEAAAWEASEFVEGCSCKLCNREALKQHRSNVKALASK